MCAFLVSYSDMGVVLTQTFVSYLQVLLTEIGARFVPLPEERLLAVVHALLHRCYKYPTATTAEVPQSLKKELAGVCRACFSTDTVNKHVEFVNEYKREFERDLDPESATTFPSTLAELTERLKHWKGVLQVSNCTWLFLLVLKAAAPIVFSPPV
jgi:transformation/transcription domain-associated protein